MSFVTRFPKLFNESKPAFTGFTDDVANFLLTYDNLFNSIMCSRVLLNYKNNDIDQFYKLYRTSYAKELTFYLRYIVVELAWGGWAMTRPVHELLWGYEDPFIMKLKH
jgi:hypothetical protein